MHNMPFFDMRFEDFKKINGLVHSYCISEAGILLDANSLQIEFFKEYFGKTENFIGKSLQSIFEKIDTTGAIIRTILEENKSVISEQSAKQFHTTWRVNNDCELKLLTIKFPFYKDGKIEGVIGVTQYVGKIVLCNDFKACLSKREFESISYFVNGKTMKEIADILEISPRTVEDYINNVKRKLGCNSKAEVIAKVIFFNIDTMPGNRI